MAKIPIILEPGRADGKLVTTNSIFDENKRMFQSEINDIQDTLTSDNSNKPLSAKQGKILKELLDSKVIEAGSVPIDTTPIEGNITHLVNSDGLAKEFNKHNTEIILGGVYDISSHNDNVVFESLSALLSSSNLSTLIPPLVRHGGMSIRFIQGSVPSSDNKYVQYRLISQTFTTIVDYWQDETDLKLSNTINDSDLDFTDEEGNVLVRFSDGGIKTKNFDSSEVDLKVGNGNDSEIDLEFTDEEGNVLIRASEGHIRTSKFNSKMFTGNQYTNTYYGERINLYGNTYDIEKIELNSVSTTPPRQGFDISNNLGVILQHTGICNIFNLETLQLIQSFNLASYDPVNNHANTLSFGKDVAEGSEFPLMYISIGTVGAANGFTCSVEKIVKNNDIYSSIKVQTIELDTSGFAEKGYTAPWDVPTWLIDKKRNYLWTFSAKKRTTSNYTSSFSENYYIAHQYSIPDINESTVVLTANDVLKECVFPFDVYATQGGTMLDGKIYYCFGFGGIGTEHSNVRIYDTDNNGISSAIDLIGKVPEECEDVAIFNGNLYLSTSSEYIYKLKF